MAHKSISQHTSSELNQGARVTKYGASRLLAYAPPWLIWLFTLGMALTGRWLWGGSPWFPMGAELATIGGCWIVWKMSKGLHEVLRVLAMASVVVIGLFV